MNSCTKHVLVDAIRNHCVLNGNFVLRSGAKSKKFIDLKRLTLVPGGMSLLGHALLETITEEIYSKGNDIDIIAGVAEGGIPLVTAIMNTMSEPYWRFAINTYIGSYRPQALWVRKDSKDHGVAGDLVGEIDVDYRDTNTIVLEDVVSTGGSVLKAVEKLSQHGANIGWIISVVNRSGQENPFKNLKAKYISLLSDIDVFK